MSRVQREVQIRNQRGLHARASAKFVTLASRLPAAVTVARDGTEVAGTSIMGLMMLGAAMGDYILISASGEDQEYALDQLCALVDDKFGED